MAITVKTGTEKPHVGIIGRGHVGSALAEGLERSGYSTRKVGNEPEKVADTAQWANIIILAVPFGERDNALQEMGDAVDGKVLIDVTNAVGEQGKFLGTLERSGAEELQEKASTAHVVKAFNTVFAQHMSHGKVNGERLTLFVAGDVGPAKDEVRKLGAALGFDPVDAGPLGNAKWLETLGYFNIQLGFKQWFGADIGFRFIHPVDATAGSQAPAVPG